MRTFSLAVAAGAVALMGLVLFANPDPSVRAAEPGLSEGRTATQAYRDGLSELKAGDNENALASLEFSAKRGVLGAQLKLAALYGAGDVVARDDGKAFRYYRDAADGYADISPAHPVAPLVGKAFLALSGYYRAGVPAIGLKPDPKRATGLLSHAASYFGDPDAQFELARMYLDGDGVTKNVSLGVNWLAKAAKKQQLGAQATLGELLWRGSDVRRRAGRGLAILMLARDRARNAGDDQEWVVRLAETAWAEADHGARQEAEALALVWGVPEAVQIDGRRDDERSSEAAAAMMALPHAAFAEPIEITPVAASNAMSMKVTGGDESFPVRGADIAPR